MTTTAEPQTHGGKKHLGMIFAALVVAMLLASLNQTVLATALPTMVGELNGVEHMAWVITAFILASTVMMPIYGKLGDMYGRKHLLIGAIAVFVGGSVMGALAQDMNLLIAARAVQGIGGGGLIILSQAIIADVVPARERGKYMGIMGGVFAVSSVAGPLLGGWLTEGPGWRWAFWINVPIGLVAIVAAAVLIHLPKPPAEGRGRIDYAGMALLAAATTAIVLIATWGGGTYAWSDPVILWLIGIAVVSVALFIWVESRAAEPVIPLMLFRNRNFNLVTVAGLAVGIMMFGALGYMPTYLQMVTGFGAAEAGLLMIPMMGVMLCTSIIVGRRVSATGRYKRYMVVGSLVIGAGLAGLSTVHADTPIVMVCLFLGVMGLGLGSTMQNLTLVAQNSFALRFVGTATASVNYFRQVGATLGSAIVGSLFASRLTSELASKLPPEAASAGATGSSLTPELVTSLPEPLHTLIVEAYNHALMPLFMWIAPLSIVAFVLLCFLQEKELATKLER
ncbi:MDR family MFS transporter [Zhihengliuella flava]|uniref:EmrB/QacA subfamily drug resistance transporter n=1 Tax=Zhihengliuella flava TaxID=1285193 RepID=A0A931D9J1_9MICC|nr:MDR family MFS transporter [Zhihengliuella flava]MBG6084508.1 EmrB/QacA subfamily drug resistance transporter [Zhihengliuella flava]